MRDPKRIYSHVHTKTQILDLLDALQAARPEWLEAYNAIRIALGDEPYPKEWFEPKWNVIVLEEDTDA